MSNLTQFGHYTDAELTRFIQTEPMNLYAACESLRRVHSGTWGEADIKSAIDAATKESAKEALTERDAEIKARIADIKSDLEAIIGHLDSI
jgi:hypothetical protein